MFETKYTNGFDDGHEVDPDQEQDAAAVHQLELDEDKYSYGEGPTRGVYTEAESRQAYARVSNERPDLFNKD